MALTFKLLISLGMLPDSLFCFEHFLDFSKKVERDGKTEPGRGGWPQAETEQSRQGSTQVVIMMVTVVNTMMIRMIMIIIMSIMMMTRSWTSLESMSLRRKSSTAGKEGM